jgi:polar amino acid transport system substrate-binding protein
MRRLTVFTTAALLLATAGCGGSGKAEDNPYGLIEPGVIHAVTQTAQPPFDFADTRGKPAGFVIDLAAEAAKRLGLKIDYKTTTVAASLTGLTSGQYDLAAEGLGVTAERAKTVIFTKPLFWSTTVVLTKGPGAADPAGYAGKRVGVVTGAAQEPFVTGKMTRAAAVKFPAIDAEVNQLLAGNLDAVALGGPDADAYIQQHPGLVASVSVPVDHPTSMAAPKDHGRLVDALNKQLEAMVADGSFVKLYKRYFHEPAQPELVSAWPQLGDQLAKL